MAQDSIEKTFLVIPKENGNKQYIKGLFFVTLANNNLDATNYKPLSFIKYISLFLAKIKFGKSVRFAHTLEIKINLNQML